MKKRIKSDTEIAAYFADGDYETIREQAILRIQESTDLPESMKAIVVDCLESSTYQDIPSTEKKATRDFNRLKLAIGKRVASNQHKNSSHYYARTHLGGESFDATRVTSERFGVGKQMVDEAFEEWRPFIEFVEAAYGLFLTMPTDEELDDLCNQIQLVDSPWEELIAREANQFDAQSQHAASTGRRAKLFTLLEQGLAVATEKDTVPPHVQRSG